MKDLDASFALLSQVLRRHAAGLSIRTDEPGHLYVERLPATGSGKPGFFGAVQVKKAYVSYHLMPVYENPGLLAGISDALRNRRQGKSCFNFTAVDPGVLQDLDALTRECAAAVR